MMKGTIKKLEYRPTSLVTKKFHNHQKMTIYFSSQSMDLSYSAHTILRLLSTLRATMLKIVNSYIRYLEGKLNLLGRCWKATALTLQSLMNGICFGLILLVNHTYMKV